MKNTLPEYLQAFDSDDVEIRMFKAVGARHCERLSAGGMVSAQIARIQFYDLGDDMQSPLNADGLDVKIVALSRFLIERFSEGRSNPIWRERFNELKRLDQQFVLTPMAAELLEIKQNRKTINQANAQKPRPNGQVVDHEYIRAEFKRLIRIGHTEREARGLLGGRKIASMSTIYRVTKAK